MMRICTLFIAALCGLPVHADTVVIAFDQPNQYATSGATLQFFGSITNLTSLTVFLNGDGLSLDGSPDLSTNDLFFTTVPISLGPGATSGDIELFDVIVSSPLTNPPATYAGTYTLFGGADGNAQDNLGSASFSVAAPEPLTFYSTPACLLALYILSKMTRSGSTKV